MIANMKEINCQIKVSYSSFLSIQESLCLFFNFRHEIVKEVKCKGPEEDMNSVSTYDDQKQTVSDPVDGSRNENMTT